MAKRQDLTLDSSMDMKLRGHVHYKTTHEKVSDLWNFGLKQANSRVPTWRTPTRKWYIYNALCRTRWTQTFASRDPLQGWLFIPGPPLMRQKTYIYSPKYRMH